MKSMLTGLVLGLALPRQVTLRTPPAQVDQALDDDLLAQVAVGDVVEIYVEREEARDAAPAPPPEVVPDAAPLPVVDDATAAVLDTWERQSGTSVDARITAWESYLASHADSPYADAVRFGFALVKCQGTL